jgi:flagellar protein FlaG
MEIQATGSPLPAAGPAQRIAPAIDAAAATQPAAAPVAVNASAVQQPAAVPNIAEVAQAVKSINRALQEQNRDLEFSVDADSNRTIVKVIDQATGEVVRQIPTEEALQIAKALDQATGLLIKQKA